MSQFKFKYYLKFAIKKGREGGGISPGTFPLFYFVSFL